MELGELGDVTPEPFVARGPDPAPPAPALALHALAGQIGAEVAEPLSSALERVNELARTGQIGKRGLRALREEIERARRAAMMGQQISRLASGRVRQMPERLDLPQLLRDAISLRGREIEARGFEVRQVLRPASVSADPTLTFSLLQALFDWAFEHCCARTIHVMTDVRSWPVRGQLTCEFAWRPADQIDTESRSKFDAGETGDAAVLDTIAWRLVERAAHTMGIVAERSDSAWQVRLLLEFPLAVDGEATAPGALDDGERLALNSEPLAGSHVLVVSARREVRNQVRMALRPMGLMVDYVTSSESAREFCRGGMPHALIHDAELDGFDALRAELLAEVPVLALLQVVDGAGALEVATGGSAQGARIGVEVIADALPQALIYALSRQR